MAKPGYFLVNLSSCPLIWDISLTQRLKEKQFSRILSLHRVFQVGPSHSPPHSRKYCVVRRGDGNVVNKIQIGTEGIKQLRVWTPPHPECPIPCSTLDLQGSTQDLQRGHGLPHTLPGRLEFWSRGHGMHSLEGTTGAAAGLPHHDQRTHGPGVHQVPARVVCLGHLGCHLCVW